MVLVIKTKNTDQLISHELLLDWLGFPSSKIKDAKSKLKLYFDLYNVNKNGIRSIRINNADMSILDSIILDEFEQKTNSPF
jgi:hypothetical protein